ncbi:MAG: MBL fold metallo-hydrolase [Bacteroidota bacterium]
MIKLKQFVFNPLQVNAWLVYEERLSAILIDPSFMDLAECSVISNYINQTGITIEYFVNTHGHFDHVFGSGMVGNFSNAPFFIHQNDLQLMYFAPKIAASFGFDFVGTVPKPDDFLTHGQKIKAGTIELEVIHVPGHSQGCVAFYCRSQAWLFSGDTLFAGSIGRTDLPEGNYEQIIRSIKEQLFTLPDETRVFPGHGPSTTIGKEKQSNPYVGA